MAQPIPGALGPDRSDSPEPDPTASDRLESWKEIAAFLHRDVRTVQRWEKTAGLPVHRHAAPRLRTAYAYRSELDVWWRAQRANLEEEAAAEARSEAPEAGSVDTDTGSVAPPRGLGRTWMAAASLAVMASALVLASVWLLSGPSAGSAGAPRPLSVLFTGLDNGASDSRVAAALEQAVARGLRAEGRIQFAAPERVANLLRLMKREPGLRMTPPVARELSLRDGRIRFVLAGRLYVLHSQFSLELDVIEPADGRTRESLALRADNPEDLLRAVDDEMARFRRAVLIAAANETEPTERLEKVTTPSLQALRLYTEAVHAGARRQWTASEWLARRAITEDQDFASAQAWLALALRRQGKAADEYLPFLERAVALSAHTTERERYLISGAFSDFTGDLPRAAAAYEAVFRLYPRDRRLLDVLIDVYSRMGRTREAVEMSVSRAELVPEDFYANVRAAQALAIWQGDQARARPFVSKARTLATTDAVADRPYWGAWLSVTPAFESWLAGDVKTATQVLQPLERGLNARIGRERDGFASAVGFSYLAMGRLQQAERAFQHAATPVRQINLAMLALAVGDEAQAREWLSQIRGYSAERPALFGRVGLTREAEHGLAVSAAFEHSEGIAEVTRGFVAAQHRDTDRAIAHLRRGVELLRFSGEPEYFLALEVLARTWKTRGQRDRAARLLAEGLDQRARTCGSAQWAGAFWIKLNTELLASYQQEGRGREAERLSTTLRQLLSTADTDHPLAKVVQRIASADGHSGPGADGPPIEARLSNP